MSETPAGWYPDGSGNQRYWDGAGWTEHTAPVVGAVDPGPTTVRHGVVTVAAGENVGGYEESDPAAQAVVDTRTAGRAHRGPRARSRFQVAGLLGAGLAVASVLWGVVLHDDYDWYRGLEELMTWVTVRDGFVTSLDVAALVLGLVGLITLLAHRRIISIVVWSLVLLRVLLTLVAALIVDGQLSIPGVVVLAAVLSVVGAGLALLASWTIDRSGERQFAVDEQVRRSAAQHDARVAQIAQWDAAYREVHGGQAPPPGFMMSQMPVALGPARTNTMAILALAFGIGGGLLGIVFGHMALSQIATTGERGRGMAIAGLVLGYAGLVASVGVVVFFLVLAS